MVAIDIYMKTIFKTASVWLLAGHIVAAALIFTWQVTSVANMGVEYDSTFLYVGAASIAFSLALSSFITLELGLLVVLALWNTLSIANRGGVK